MEPFPARLHVLLAKNPLTGLVIRRGPSKRVATILWNRERDEFQLGQWLKGVIYERRSDLSPDGKLFLYFAMNGKWQSEARGSWTAISRAPYLKALTMLSKGDCWNGGGLWTGKATYFLNDGYGHRALWDRSGARRDRAYIPPVRFGGECPGVYYPRLLRDGWTLVESRKFKSSTFEDIFDKPLGKGWVLRKIAHTGGRKAPGQGCYWDEHQLIHLATQAVVACPTWEWADLDGRRLVWAARGKLHGGVVGHDGLVDEKEIYDFNEMKFEAIKAPY